MGSQRSRTEASYLSLPNVTNVLIEKHAQISLSPSNLPESSIISTDSSAIITSLNSISVEPIRVTDSPSSLSNIISQPALFQPRSPKLSPETPKPKGQIDKVRYRRALSLTLEDLNEMMVFGTSICQQHDILDDVSTLRKLQKNNSKALERVMEQVNLRSKAADCVNSSKNQKSSNASESCPGQPLPYYN